MEEKYILHLDRLEYNFNLEIPSRSYYESVLPINRYELEDNKIFKFNSGFWLVCDSNIVTKSTFYLGFKVYYKGAVFGKLLMHEKRQMQLVRFCMDKDILYTYQPKEWRSILKKLQTTLFIEELGAYYLEIALDTTKQVRKQESYIYHNSTINDECTNPIYQPKSKMVINTLHNNRQYVIGNTSHNLVIYEKGKSLDDVTSNYFMKNGFKSDELESINRVELRMRRKHLTQINKKFDLTLDALIDRENLAFIFDLKSKKFRMWQDLENGYFNKSRNKKYPELDILDFFKKDYKVCILKTTNKPVEGTIYKKPDPKRIIRQNIDQYMKTNQVKYLDLVRETSCTYGLDSNELKYTITSTFESVGKSVTNKVWSHVLPEKLKAKGAFEKAKNMITHHWNNLFL